MKITNKQNPTIKQAIKERLIPSYEQKEIQRKKRFNKLNNVYNQIASLQKGMKKRKFQLAIDNIFKEYVRNKYPEIYKEAVEEIHKSQIWKDNKK